MTEYCSVLCPSNTSSVVSFHPFLLFLSFNLSFSGKPFSLAWFKSSAFEPTPTPLNCQRKITNIIYKLRSLLMNKIFKIYLFQFILILFLYTKKYSRIYLENLFSVVFFYFYNVSINQIIFSLKFKYIQLYSLICQIIYNLFLWKLDLSRKILNIWHLALLPEFSFATKDKGHIPRIKGPPRIAQSSP